MKKTRLLGAICASVFSFISISSHAALVDNGQGLIYDTVLDVTWSQPVNTYLDWYEATAWAAGLTLGGVSGWRLPYISVAAGAGPFPGNPLDFDCSTITELACRDNELGYMFYHNLGGSYGSSILTSGDPDLALFPTLTPNQYWSGTEYGFNAAWYFAFYSGAQEIEDLPYHIYSWAVHAGDIRPIPIPAAVWLFGSGLLGLIGISRRKKAA